MKIKKKVPFLLFLVLMVVGCNYSKGNDRSEKENIITSRVYHKSNFDTTDTIRVSQNDSSFFKREEIIIHRPDSHPKLSVQYTLKHPKDGAYYLIYNDKKQLIKEGRYTSQYTYEGQTYKEGNFYNLKMYSYKSNGNLDTIHYQEDGRNLKTEFFDNKSRLKKIIYFNKKSADKEKVEIYKNGKLREINI
nr:hypothetical protein [uncultured Chryseobacterium sp.]